MNNCKEGAHCWNVDGGYKCTCKNGFDADDFGCNDIDECKSDELNDCWPGAPCTNIDGGYQCNCRAGFLHNGLGCFDFDECSLGNIRTYCRAIGGTCSNTEGYFDCICPDGTILTPWKQPNENCGPKCDPGYSGMGDSCSDIDECAAPNLNNCEEGAPCNNFEGGYSCTCKAGYVALDFGCFLDSSGECSDGKMFTLSII